jgi:hypothetical protein
MSDENVRYHLSLWDWIELLSVVALLGAMALYGVASKFFPGIAHWMEVQAYGLELLWYNTLEPALLSREAAIVFGVGMLIAAAAVILIGIWIWYLLIREICQRLTGNA